METKTTDVIDLFELAESNNEYLDKQQENVGLLFNERNQTQLMEHFLNYIEETGKMAINMDDYIITPFIEGTERLKNRYDFFENDMEKIQARSKDYHQVRCNFDESFIDGKRFTYLALNTGNSGILKWGDYCIVISDIEKMSNIAYLKHNSLKKDGAGGYHYFDKNSKLKMDLLSKDLSVHEKRSYLVLLKCHNALLDGSADQSCWCSLVCNSKLQEYVEGITTDDVLPSNISEIRISDRLKNILKQETQAIIEASFNGRDIPPGSAEMHWYNDLADIARKKNIVIQNYN